MSVWKYFGYDEPNYRSFRMSVVEVLVSFMVCSRGFGASNGR